MRVLPALVKRNTKLFFKDKGMFFTSLITPLILLVLYATFLGKVYRNAYTVVFPSGFEIDEKLLNGAVGAQLFSSLLAVCCVTVAFCSNLLSVNDKASGVMADFTVTPVRKPPLALGYFISSFISTLIICMVTTAVCFIYLAFVGWYMSFSDVIMILADVILLVTFGTALSSVITYFLSSQGQISAVGTVVSAGYGFICGAYMPISQFGKGLQNALAFFPGTYGTSILRNYSSRGVFAEMERQNVPSESINALRKVMDCEIYFFEKSVPLYGMFLILAFSVLVLIGIYILINVFCGKRK